MDNIFAIFKQRFCKPSSTRITIFDIHPQKQLKYYLVCFIFCLLLNHLLNWEFARFIANLSLIILIIAPISVLNTHFPTLNFDGLPGHITIGNKREIRISLLNEQKSSSSPCVLQIGYRQLSDDRLERNARTIITERKVPTIKRNQTFELALDIPSSRRGFYQIEYMNLIRSDILDICQKKQQNIIQKNFYIHPKTFNFNLNNSLFFRNFSAGIVDKYCQTGFDIEGLYEMQDGVSIKNISHKHSAKYDANICKRYDEYNISNNLLLIFNHRDLFDDDHDFEAAISNVASVGGSLITHNANFEICDIDSNILYTNYGSLAGDSRKLLNTLSMIDYSNHISFDCIQKLNAMLKRYKSIQNIFIFIGVHDDSDQEDLGIRISRTIHQTLQLMPIKSLQQLIIIASNKNHRTMYINNFNNIAMLSKSCGLSIKITKDVRVSLFRINEPQDIQGVNRRQ